MVTRATRRNRNAKYTPASNTGEKIAQLRKDVDALQSVVGLLAQAALEEKEDIGSETSEPTSDEASEALCSREEDTTGKAGGASEEIGNAEEEKTDGGIEEQGGCAFVGST